MLELALALALLDSFPDPRPPAPPSPPRAEIVDSTASQAPSRAVLLFALPSPTCGVVDALGHFQGAPCPN